MFDEHKKFEWVDKNYFILIINSFNLIKYSQQGTEFPANLRRVQDLRTPPPAPISIRTMVYDQVFGWGQEVTYPSPYERFFPLSTPFFKMFFERFFNNPLLTLLQTFFTVTPIPHLPPLPSSSHFNLILLSSVPDHHLYFMGQNW